MLILTRKEGEALVIAEHIEVHVMEVKNGQVKLGVDAPRNISVHRKEVQLKINRETNGNR